MSPNFFDIGEKLFKPNEVSSNSSTAYSSIEISSGNIHLQNFQIHQKVQRKPIKKPVKNPIRKPTSKPSKRPIQVPTLFPDVDTTGNSNLVADPYDQCVEYWMIDYLNRPAVQSAIHVRPTTDWQECTR